MKFDLFQRAIVVKDFPLYGLQKGDVGIVVERISRPNQHDGYILEFFDALGNTIDVVPFLESDLDIPRPNTILTYRETTRAA